MPLERVHFHEVGAIDSIVDLVGAAAAVEFLAAGAASLAARSTWASGTVKTAHGEAAGPGAGHGRAAAGACPSTADRGGELTTPTGAVLLAELVDEFVRPPGDGAGRHAATGWGRKTSRPAQRAAAAARAGAARRGPRSMVVECEVDDLPGEGFGFLMERLLEAGALDVYFTPVQMKKNRPGTLITLLCRRDQLEALAASCSTESGSLGCRFHAAARFEAEREILRGRDRRSARCGSSVPASTAGRSPQRPSSRTAGAWRSPAECHGARSTAAALAASARFRS